jgi:hypothetical protein
MKDGSFHASGTPQFLKQRFQVPCTLRIITNPRKREFFKKTGSPFVLSFQGLDAKLINAVGNMYMYDIPQASSHTIPMILDSLDRFVQANIIVSLNVETPSLSELCRIISEDVDDISMNSTAVSTECDESNPFCDANANTKECYAHIEVSWITQVALMCWKRWQIRKRRVFRMALHLLIFGALGALSLAVLAVPTLNTDYTIRLSPAFSNLHKESFLPVGGGATLTNPYTSPQVMIDKFNAIESAMAIDESQIHVRQRFPSVLNSSAMSQSLYMERDTDALGAFVLFDILPFRWDVNWPFYRKYLLQLQSAYQTTVGNWSLSSDVQAYETLLNAAMGGTVELSPEMVNASVAFAAVNSLVLRRLGSRSSFGLQKRP